MEFNHHKTATSDRTLHTEPVKDKSKNMSDIFVNSQLSAPQGCSTPLSSRCEGVENPSFFFDAASSSTGQPFHTETVEGGRGMSESRDRGSILKSLREIKDKIEDYDVKNEEGNYSEGYKEHITDIMEKMGNLISAFMKEDWLTELLKRQQEKAMSQEDVELLHLIEELISIFKDHVGYASLTRALKPLTGIENCFKSGNLSYKMSQRFEKKLCNVATCCQGIGLFHDGEKEQQDHSTSDFGYGMSTFCEDEMFDYTLNNSRSLLRSKHMVEDKGTSKEGIDFVDYSFSSGISSFNNDNKDIFQPARRMSRLFVHNGPSDNKSSPVSFKRAQECVEKGDNDGAIKVYDEIAKRESLSGYKNQVASKAIYNAAILFFREKKYSNAEEKFQEMLTDVGLRSTDALHQKSFRKCLVFTKRSYLLIILVLYRLRMILRKYNVV